MKIAVASEDGVSISHHFGRSRCFLVFETQDKQIVGQSLRDNTFTAHARGECQEGQPNITTVTERSSTPCGTAKSFCAMVWVGGLPRT